MPTKRLLLFLTLLALTLSSTAQSPDEEDPADLTEGSADNLPPDDEDGDVVEGSGLTETQPPATMPPKKTDTPGRPVVDPNVGVTTTEKPPSGTPIAWIIGIVVAIILLIVIIVIVVYCVKKKSDSSPSTKQPYPTQQTQQHKPYPQQV